MPTIINGLGKKRIEKICEESKLSWEEKNILLKILHEWDRVVDKKDKIKILDNYIGRKNKEECEKIVNALIQINREYNKKVTKKEIKRKIREGMASHVRG